jgi:hypothetical protein
MGRNMKTKNILNKFGLYTSSLPKPKFNPWKRAPASTDLFSNILGNKKHTSHLMNSPTIKNFGFKTFGGKSDWDGDGVPNKKDCQPRNVMRQHRYNAVVKKNKVFTSYKNPEGKELRVYGKPENFGIEESSYIMDELPASLHPENVPIHIGYHESVIGEIEKQKGSSEEEIKKQIKSLRHANGIEWGYPKPKGVVVFTDTAHDHFPEKGYDVKHFDFSGTPTRESSAGVLIHELGHAAFDTVLTPEAKQDWNDNIYPLTAPTWYGSRNENEDFAETFTSMSPIVQKTDTTFVDRFHRTDPEIKERYDIINRGTNNIWQQKTAREEAEEKLRPEYYIAESMVQGNNNNKPYGDKDKDGIINADDCAPNNPYKQGKLHTVNGVTNAILYHGTTAQRIPSIKQYGLQPQHSMLGKVIYLTPSFKHAAYHAKKHSQPVVLEVAVPYSSISNYSKNEILNEKHPTQEIRTKQTVSPNNIKVHQIKGASIQKQRG